MTDIRSAIREVLAQERTGVLKGKDLINACTELAARARTPGSGAEFVPHEIWHYLSDADIRVKDSAYAKAQLEQVARLL